LIDYVFHTGINKVHIPKIAITSLALLGLLAGCGPTDNANDATGADEAVAKTLDDFDLISRDIFFGNATRIQGRISPDGSQMSFMAPLDGVQNLWVGPTGNFAEAKAITDDKLRGIASHQWALNGRNLLYLRDQGGDEDFLETVVFNRGGPLQFFETEKEAKSWLGVS
jgi:hypothetical protein